MQVLLDVPVAILTEDDPQQPGEKRRASDRRHEHHPEPDEQVDLLVEQVNWKNALNRVPLDVSETTNFEVAHGYSRESGWRGPVLASQGGSDDVDAVQIKIRSKEAVQNEQLTDDVGQEEDLDGQI